MMASLFRFALFHQWGMEFLDAYWKMKGFFEIFGEKN